MIAGDPLSSKLDDALTQLRIVGELRELSNWTLEREMGNRATLPANREQDDFRLSLDVNGNVVDELTNNLFVLSRRGGGCGPKSGDVEGELTNELDLLSRQRRWVLLDKALIVLLHLLQREEFGFPLVG